jgi:ribulose-phosphate 3-epimerase
MIENPDRFIPTFVKAGADYISVQVEACVHLHRTIQLIKSQGVKAGVVLNPATPISGVEWVLGDLDFVLIMSVNPGFGGQQFIESSLDKIRRLRSMISAQKSSALIQIDGGVNAETVDRIVEAGAQVLVAGSAIFGSSDYRTSVDRLKK